MAYLTIGDYYTAVPVDTASPQMRVETIGEVRRAFSGVPRSSVRARYNVWEIETRWMPRATADDIMEALAESPPIDVGGDMLSAASALAVNVRRSATTRAVVAGVNTEMVKLSMELWETAAAT